MTDCRATHRQRTIHVAGARIVFSHFAVEAFAKVSARGLTYERALDELRKFADHFELCDSAPSWYLAGGEISEKWLVLGDVAMPLEDYGDRYVASTTVVHNGRLALARSRQAVKGAQAQHPRRPAKTLRRKRKAPRFPAEAAV